MGRLEKINRRLLSAKNASPSGRNPSMALPRVMMRAKARAMLMVASVGTKGSMRSLVTQKPLNRPTDAEDQEREQARRDDAQPRMHHGRRGDGSQAPDTAHRQVDTTGDHDRSLAQDDNPDEREVARVVEEVVDAFAKRARRSTVPAS